MSLQRDIVDIYTKSSVYYLRLQYLVVCYLIVLAGAFFILPLPREMGINGNPRLMVGGLLYIGFAVLLVYAPKLLKSTVGKFLSPDEYEEEIKNKLKEMPEQAQIALEEKIFEQGKTTIKIFAKQDLVTLNKKQTIATNIFFQCLLIELFCLVVFINSDQSLLISNSITQNIADILLPYTRQTAEQLSSRSGYFSIRIISMDTKGSSYSISFNEFHYMAESIFFIYVIFMISFVIRLLSMFIFSRPILAREDVFHMIKDIYYQFIYIIDETILLTIKNIIYLIGKIIWAIFGTVIISAIGICGIWFLTSSLQLFIQPILIKGEWIHYSVLMISVFMILFLIFLRFMEDWYKLIFRKF